MTSFPPPVMNLGRLLSDTARAWPGRIGLVRGEEVWRWQEIDGAVNALVAGLCSLGLAKGQRILIASRNRPEMFFAMWAVFKLGAVAVPVNPRLTPPEMAYLAAHSGAVAILHDSGFEPHVAAMRAAAPAIGRVLGFDGDYPALVAAHRGAPAWEEEVGYGDPLWFFYTSGTTGRPKAGVLTHGQMAFVTTNHLADLMPGLTVEDASLVVAPLSHGAGVHMLSQVARGAKSVLPVQDRLDPAEVWALVERWRVSNMFTVPTIVKMLVEHPAVDRHDHSSLRHLIYAGAPMYRADQKLALAKLGRVLVQYFGLGEVTGNITVLPAYLHREDDAAPDARIGTCGLPRTGMEIGILDPEGRRLPPFETGEICCRGPAVFAGYHDNPEATAKALKGGWFHTGDLGHVDAEGFVYITGRASDMYISGGSNIYPRECEEILLAHPAVSEVAVLGVPDAKWGEVGVAVVVLRAGQTADEAALLAHLDGRLARYKWPRRFFFWEALPKSGYGKITKQMVREELYARGEIARQESA
ncbi:MAG: acyl-CoA synthetase [Thalassobaculales bacterium]